MSDGPLLSFIVLSYNYADYIGISIQSILDQTVQDFEVVVVDDASEDRSCDVIRSFGDVRIRLLVNDRNMGGAASYNRAVQAATGKYLVNLDSDDWITPDKAERQLAAMAKQPVEILGTYAYFVDKDGKPHPGAAEFEQLINQAHDLNKASVWIGRNNLVRSTTMVDRAAHFRIGLDDPSMVRAPDFELWTRALRAGCRFGLLAEPLTYFRVHPGGVTHGDPISTFLELSYATLRNLVQLVEVGQSRDGTALIARWILAQGRCTAMHLPQEHRLLGMLLYMPTFADFADFRRQLYIEDEATGLDTSGRRLLAMLETELSRMEKLQADLVAVSDARDFWHNQSKAAMQARDFWHQTSDAWEKECRSLQQAVRARRGVFHRALRTAAARLRTLMDNTSS